MRNTCLQNYNLFQTPWTLLRYKESTGSSLITPDLSSYKKMIMETWLGNVLIVWRSIHAGLHLVRLRSSILHMLDLYEFSLYSVDTAYTSKVCVLSNNFSHNITSHITNELTAGSAAHGVHWWLMFKFPDTCFPWKVTLACWTWIFRSCLTNPSGNTT